MSYPFDCITEFMFFETKLEPADVILIPGAGQPRLMERAAELYHQGFAPTILPSGGPSRNVETTEWAFLREIGLALGVPDHAILREDRAANTFENARFSKQVLQQKGVIPKKAILVCKSYHARRALLTYQVDFKETMFDVSPITDKTGITKENWFLDDTRIAIVMKELTKVGQYFAHHIPNWVE
ncbi:YdcF family protein [Paenibacillus sp. MWE-103]|uniref:YdcF family protein n=1 Tax=Paenibacillus artemisiicola TaxID=1172618 RepID=A0ABS3WA16_9BACL|nr:YdcF family protein [Paenibacillus artemisiicola]MBO7745122.1 YdcF family protein [Paenibacillus artemisiicola]